ncbi:MAG: hypothetical protein CFH15_00700 [Alphaproteobacteria bacterium MarineAlpha5_Bin5]|nr:MAG: hypothetical protein CFH15_00700 [Alphaproteobacteria bacterium MarineAlpha5_Bin5]|tara:strand:- start:2382 stop:2522 length:141 start_codon:yes stop_codon:yes gene_type:complete
MKKPINLEQIKNNHKLSKLAFIKQRKLFVMPILKKEWNEIIKISEN